MAYCIVVTTKRPQAGWPSQLIHQSRKQPYYNLDSGVVIVYDELGFGDGAYSIYPLSNVLGISVRPVKEKTQE